jgi:hypothetical protein
MECFEQSSAQVLWLPAKEDAARYKWHLNILDSMGSDHVSRYDHPSDIASAPHCFLKSFTSGRAGGLICEPLKAVWPAYAGIFYSNIFSCSSLFLLG